MIFDYYLLKIILNHLDDVNRLIVTLLCKKLYIDREKYLLFKIDSIDNYKSTKSSCFKSYQNIISNSLAINLHSLQLQKQKQKQKQIEDEQFDDNQDDPNRYKKFKFISGLSFSDLPLEVEELIYNGGVRNDGNDQLVFPSWITKLVLENVLHLPFELPETLKEFTFGRLNNNRVSIDKREQAILVPRSYLSFRGWYKPYVNDQRVFILPKSLVTLTFGPSYNHPLLHNTLPPSLERLSFGNSFNWPIKENVLPMTLTELYLGDSYNQMIYTTDNDGNGTTLKSLLPPTLKILSFGDRFNKPLKAGSLPESLTELSLGLAFDAVLYLPQSLKKLNIALLSNLSNICNELNGDLEINMKAKSKNNNLSIYRVVPILKSLNEIEQQSLSKQYHAPQRNQTSLLFNNYMYLIIDKSFNGGFLTNKQKIEKFDSIMNPINHSFY